MDKIVAVRITSSGGEDTVVLFTGREKNRKALARFVVDQGDGATIKLKIAELGYGRETPAKE